MSLKQAFLFTGFALITSPVWAAYSIMDNGEVMTAHKYKLTAGTQVLTENAGININLRGDMGLTESAGLRALLGFGKTDVFAGGFFKWLPFRETETKPNIGGNLGLVYVKDGDIKDILVRLEPLVSKRMEVENVFFTPFVSTPVSYRSRKNDGPMQDETDVTLQMVIGSQLELPHFKNLQFIAEVGIDLNEAPGFINVAAIYYFDPEKGLTLEQPPDYQQEEAEE